MSNNISCNSNHPFWLLLGLLDRLLKENPTHRTRHAVYLRTISHLKSTARGRKHQGQGMMAA